MEDSDEINKCKLCPVSVSVEVFGEVASERQRGGAGHSSGVPRETTLQTRELAAAQDHAVKHNLPPRSTHCVHVCVLVKERESV